MKKLNELKSERSDINDQINVILNSEEITDEQRSEVSELETKVDALKSDIELLERQEERNAQIASVNIIETSTDNDEDNFMRAISEYETAGTVSSEFRGNGGGIVIPKAIYRADPLVTTTNADIVNKKVGGINIKLTPAAAFLASLGVQRYNNVNGQFVLPSAGQVTAGWVGEGNDVSTGDFTPAAITLAPRALGVTQSWTKEFNAVTNPDMIQANMQAMFNAIDVAVTKDLFEQIKVDAAAAQYTHVGGTLGQDTILGMEAALEFGPNKIVATPAIKSYMKAMEVGTGMRSLWEMNNTVEGYDAVASTVVSSDNIFFGNFGDAAVAQFGDLELILDPYTSAKSRKILATLNGLYDSGYANYRGISWLVDGSTY